MTDEQRSLIVQDESETPMAGSGRGMAAAEERRTDWQAPGNGADAGNAPLFADTETADFRNRWRDIQGSFVDNPRTAVKQADELVASTTKRLADIFAGERDRLEHEWDKGDNVSTEDLRQALHRYRSFFNRLLSV